MKKIFTLLACMTSISFAARSQNTIRDLQGQVRGSAPKALTDTIVKSWKTGGFLDINISQASQSNWAAGGDNFSFSATGLFNAYAYYLKGKNSWQNNVNMAYGYLNTTTLGTRKNADSYDLTTEYGYAAGKNWYYSALADFRSQFSNGYLYPTTGPAQFNSAFLSPAYVLLSLGMEYKPNDSFSVFISPITSRWTLVTNDTLSFYGKYGVTPGSHVLNQIGAYVSANYILPLSSSVVYTTELNIFSDYEKDPQDLDIYFTNLLAIKLRKLLTLTISVNLIYDNNVLFPNSSGGMGPRLQFQELTGLGLSYKF